MKTSLRDSLAARIIDAGFEPERYSGRGMFGESCLGVTLPDVGSLTLINTAQIDFQGVVRTPRTDAMGKGMVAYWPGVPPPPED